MIKSRGNRQNFDENEDDNIIRSEDDESSEDKPKKAKRKNVETLDSDEVNFEETTGKKKRKNLWNVIKSSSTKQNSENDDKDLNDQSLKEKNFFKILKRKKKEGKESQNNSQEYEQQQRSKSLTTTQKEDNNKSKSLTKKPVDENEIEKSPSIKNDDDQSEAADRKEIIALLDELKKMEIQQLEEKKKESSVVIQYLAHDPNKSFAFRPEEFCRLPGFDKKSRDIQRNCTYCDKRYSMQYDDIQGALNNYNYCDDTSERQKLLPCDCERYLDKKKDFIHRKNYGFKKPSECKSFFKIFRGSSSSSPKNYFNKEMNLFKRGNENFFLNKYKSVSTDTSDEILFDELIKKGKKNDFDMEERVLNSFNSSYSPRYKTTFASETETLRHESVRKKKVQLKESGVLCRL